MARQLADQPKSQRLYRSTKRRLEWIAAEKAKKSPPRDSAGRPAMKAYKLLSYFLYCPTLERLEDKVVVSTTELNNLMKDQTFNIYNMLEWLKDAGLITSLTIKSRYVIVGIKEPINYVRANIQAVDATAAR